MRAASSAQERVRACAWRGHAPLSAECLRSTTGRRFSSPTALEAASCRHVPDGGSVPTPNRSLASDGVMLGASHTTTLSICDGDDTSMAAPTSALSVAGDIVSMPRWRMPRIAARCACACGAPCACTPRLSAAVRVTRRHGRTPCAVQQRCATSNQLSPMPRNLPRRRLLFHLVQQPSRASQCPPHAPHRQAAARPIRPAALNAACLPSAAHCGQRAAAPVAVQARIPTAARGQATALDADALCRPRSHAPNSGGACRLVGDGVPTFLACEMLPRLACAVFRSMGINDTVRAALGRRVGEDRAIAIRGRRRNEPRWSDALLHPHAAARAPRHTVCSNHCPEKERCLPVIADVFQGCAS